MRTVVLFSQKQAKKNNDTKQEQGKNKSSNNLTVTLEFPDDGIEESILRRHVSPSDRHPCIRPPDSSDFL